MDGWNTSPGSARRESNGTRQLAQGHFLFLWTLQSEDAFFSKMIQNGLGHEVRGGGNQRDRGTARGETTTRVSFLSCRSIGSSVWAGMFPSRTD